MSTSTSKPEVIPVPMKAVEDLVEGDLVDLEDDPFADPDHDPHCGFPFDYGVVGEVHEEEGTTLILVEFDNFGTYAFPRGHRVPLSHPAES